MSTFETQTTLDNMPHWQANIMTAVSENFHQHRWIFLTPLPLLQNNTLDDAAMGHFDAPQVHEDHHDTNVSK